MKVDIIQILKTLSTQNHNEKWYQECKELILDYMIIIKHNTGLNASIHDMIATEFSYFNTGLFLNTKTREKCQKFFNEL